MEKVISMRRLMVLLLTLTALVGCASSPDRQPATFGGSNDENSSAHPAAYLVDRFPVNRPLPENKSPNSEPFYFKRCSEVGGEFPYSRTSYDCHYP